MNIVVFVLFVKKVSACNVFLFLKEDNLNERPPPFA